MLIVQEYRGPVKVIFGQMPDLSGLTAGMPYGAPEDIPRLDTVPEPGRKIWRSGVSYRYINSAGGFRLRRKF